VSDAPEDLANWCSVTVWRDRHPDPECGNCHWNAEPVGWEYTIYPDGKIVHAAPSGDGETEQEALDHCRREMADFFRRGCERADWDHPLVIQDVKSKLYD
jgi:hypothetical protein